VSKRRKVEAASSRFYFVIAKDGFALRFGVIAAQNRRRGRPADHARGAGDGCQRGRSGAHELDSARLFFCGSPADEGALDATEPLRVTFYKSVTNLARTFAAVSINLNEAGFTEPEAEAIRGKVEFYCEIRDALKNHTSEDLYIKPYEADLRHLINTYVMADPPKGVGELSGLSLTELIVRTGVHDAIAQKLNAKGKLSRNGVAEGIINNLRKTIIRERLTDPRFYELMSKLLADLIQQSREEAAEYEQFLRMAEELARQIAGQRSDHGIPAALRGNHEAVVHFKNLETIPASDFQCPKDDAERAALALAIDRAVRDHAPAGWKGDKAQEKMVLNQLHPTSGA
jgi:type I restriction enzyme R subunit